MEGVELFVWEDTRDLAGAGWCKGNSGRSAKFCKVLFVPSLIYRKGNINLLLRDDCGSDSGKSFAVKIIIKSQWWWGCSYSMPSDLFAFAGNAWLYILIFEIIWVAPTLGPALIGLCYIILQKKIYQYPQNNAFDSLFHKQTGHKSICDTGSVDSDVQRVILRCISSPDLCFYSVHFESIFQLRVPVNQPWICHFPWWQTLNPQAEFGSWCHVV